MYRSVSGLNYFKSTVRGCYKQKSREKKEGEGNREENENIEKRKKRGDEKITKRTAEKERINREE